MPLDHVADERDWKVRFGYTSDHPLYKCFTLDCSVSVEVICQKTTCLMSERRYVHCNWGYLGHQSDGLAIHERQGIRWEGKYMKE